mgnify:CR=1 FL=1
MGGELWFVGSWWNDLKKICWKFEKNCGIFFSKSSPLIILDLRFSSFFILFFYYFSSLPCGDNAICIPERHAAWCRCKSGWTEDKKTGKCISKCDGMICGNNAQCIVSSEGPTCACLEGFLGNPFPGGACTSSLCSARTSCPSKSQTCENGRCVDTCRGKNCGLNAQCDADTSSCVCAEGFVGDPEHVCMPPIGPAVCDPGYVLNHLFLKHIILNIIK